MYAICTSEIEIWVKIKRKWWKIRVFGLIFLSFFLTPFRENVSQAPTLRIPNRVELGWFNCAPIVPYCAATISYYPTSSSSPAYSEGGWGDTSLPLQFLAPNQLKSITLQLYLIALILHSIALTPIWRYEEAVPKLSSLPIPGFRAENGLNGNPLVLNCPANIFNRISVFQRFLQICIHEINDRSLSS